MKNSFFGRLNGYDLLKGLIVFVLTDVITLVLKLIEGGGIDAVMNGWKQILTAGITAALAYLLKQLITNSEGQFGGEPLEFMRDWEAGKSALGRNIAKHNGLRKKNV